MPEIHSMPPRTPAGQPRLILVEAPAGPRRQEALAEWIGTGTSPDEAAFLLSCDFERAGPWAGLKPLLEQVVPQIRDRVPELVDRHAHELTLILPRLRSELEVRNLNLTDVASPEEKTRNYPMDRAFRILDGIVELLHAWHRELGLERWTLVCDDFDRAGALVRRFFLSLLRRRGQEMGLTLVLAGQPGGLSVESFPEVDTTRVRLDLPAEEAPLPPPAEMTRRAEALQEKLQQDQVELQDRLPELIYLWLNSETPERAAGWQALAFGEYNHFGFYEDALRYGQAIVDSLDRITGPGKTFTRWNLVGALANCNLALDRPERALEIIQREGMPHIDNEADRARALYVLALIYSRFLPQPDLEKAESLIDQGLAALEHSGLPHNDRHFLHVFLLNGLAFIRHRQGRPHDALELCQRGFELLQKTLDSGAHRLHRSVLLYNIAQVYAALGNPDEAIEHLTEAISFDSNYSEYYNDRGNAYLQLGRLDEAIADYHRAIELSAPYQEVWTNLGQAYKVTARLPESVEAYSRALDIDPQQVLARLGRAQAREALGDNGGALEDYNAVLEREPDQPLVLANRAGLRYENGDAEGALDDLGRALALAPEEAGLYYNRAFVLAEEGHHAAAVADLRRYLELTPDAEDRPEVQERITHLEAAA